MIHRRAIEIYRKRGFKSLVSSMQSYFFHRYNIREKLCKLCSIVNNSKTHQIGENTITVPLEEGYQIKRFCTIHNEKSLAEDMMEELNEDETIYDVGAYLGWHTLIAASMATEGTTVAFEPHPKSYDRLTEVVETAAKGDVQLYNVALSDENGSSLISERSSASASLLGNDQAGIKIKKHSGDEFIEREELPFPTTIKVDVEGKEVAVLRGLEKTISRPECQLIYCELHSDTAPEGEVVDELVRSFLERHGFEIHKLQHSSKDIIKAIKK